MRRRVRGFALFLLTFLMISAVSFKANASPEAIDARSLPNVQKALKMSPEEVKALSKQAQQGDVQINGVIGGGFGGVGPTSTHHFDHPR